MIVKKSDSEVSVEISVFRFRDFSPENLDLDNACMSICPQPVPVPNHGTGFEQIHAKSESKSIMYEQTFF